jgi:rhodanese-related sulfurtransferase
LGLFGNDRIPPISAAEAKAMIDAGAAVAVDVREPGEIAATGKLPGALAIPLGAVAARSAIGSPDHDPALDPDKAVIVYCAVGRRSETAGRTLKELGYRTVYNLGSLKDWIAAGFPVER